MATKVRLTTRDSFLKFRKVLEAGQDFAISGALRGEAGLPGSYGRLAPEYRASVDQADYVVYSYGTPIAWRVDSLWTVPPTRYSVTTTRHQSKIRVALES